MNLHAKLLVSLLAATTASMAGAQQDTMPSGAGFNQPVTNPNGEMVMPQDADDVRATTPAQDQSALGNRAPVPGTVEVAPPVEDPSTGDAMAAQPIEPVDPMATVPAPATNDSMAVDPATTEQSVTESGDASQATDTEAAISGTNPPVTGGVTVEPGEPRPINRDATGAAGTEARGGDATASAGTATIITEDGEVYQSGSGAVSGIDNPAGQSATTGANPQAAGQGSSATGSSAAGTGSGS